MNTAGDTRKLFRRIFCSIVDNRAIKCDERLRVSTFFARLAIAIRLELALKASFVANSVAFASIEWAKDRFSAFGVDFVQIKPILLHHLLSKVVDELHISFTSHIGVQRERVLVTITGLNDFLVEVGRPFTIRDAVEGFFLLGCLDRACDAVLRIPHLVLEQLRCFRAGKYLRAPRRPQFVTALLTVKALSGIEPTFF